MKKVTITVEDQNLGTLVELLAGSYNSISIETIDKVVARTGKETVSSRTVHREAKTAAEYCLEFMDQNNSKATLKQLRALLTSKGFAQNTASATMSTLLKEGIVGKHRAPGASRDATVFSRVRVEKIGTDSL